MKKGFTLTELLIALGVIGVLAAVLMPVVHSIIPDQKVMMAKRAYYTVQTAVSELINDSACYPDKTQAPGSERRVGFDDEYGYENCLWGGSVHPETIEGNFNGTGDVPRIKFDTLFSNKIGAEEETTATTAPMWRHALVSKDGIKYWTSMPMTTVEMYIIIQLPTKGDNCAQTNWTEITQYYPGLPCSEGKNPNMFALKLFADGHIEIDPTSTWVKEAVKANSSLTGK